MQRLNKDPDNVIPFLWLRQEAEAEIVAELDAMRKYGVRSFCVESRPFYPERVERGKPPCDFNSEAWFQRFGFILAEAKKRGMKVWSFDDKGFPTGKCNDKLTEETTARQIVCNFVDFVATGEKQCLMTSLKPNEGDRLLAAYVFPFREGKIRLSEGVCLPTEEHDVLVECRLNKGVYRAAFLVEGYRFGSFPRYIDMLNEKSVDVLLQEVHEKLYERFSTYFGETFAGFFSDEPCFGNAWNNAKISGFPNEYNNRLGQIGGAYPISDEVKQYLLNKGYEWKDFLSLYLDCAENTSAFRSDYAEKITSVYQRNFVQKIADWCHARGVAYIGHIIEDSGAHCRFGWSTGHYFKSMDGMDMAGIDVVLHSIKPYINEGEFLTPVNLTDPLFYKNTLAKLASSSAALDEEKQGRAVCEIFGAYGFGETIEQMLYLVHHMTVMGINRFIPHGFSMDFPDEDCPPHFFAGGKIPSWEGYALLFEYMQKLSACFDGGCRDTSVAVLYNGEAEWSGKQIQNLDLIAKYLHERQIDFDFIPHYKLKENAQKYKILIVPKAKYYPTFVEESLRCCSLPKVYLGKDFGLNRLAKFLFTHGYATKTFAKHSKDLRVLRYQKDGTERVFLFNEGLATIENRMALTGTWKRVDLLNGKEFDACIENGEDAFSLKAGEAILLMEGTAEQEQNYHFFKTVETFSIEKKSFDETMFCPFDGFDKHFSGWLRYRAQIDLTDVAKIEADYCGEFCKLTVNGKEFVRIGKAEFELKEVGVCQVEIVVCNTLANALKDRFSAYAAIENCRLKKLILYKR